MFGYRGEESDNIVLHGLLNFINPTCIETSLILYDLSWPRAGIPPIWADASHTAISTSSHF